MSDDPTMVGANYIAKCLLLFLSRDENPIVYLRYRQYNVFVDSGIFIECVYDIRRLLRQRTRIDNLN